MGEQAGAVLLVLGAAVAVGLLARALARRQLPSWARTGLVLASVIALMAMLATDWPAEALSGFWAEHSVLTSVLVTLLLAGAAFLVYDYESDRRQARLAESVASAGAGGLVGTLLSVAFVLDVIQRQIAIPERTRSDRPLHWTRSLLDMAADRGAPFAVGTASDTESPPRTVDDLLAECLRALMAALRNWSPLLLSTRDGTSALVQLGDLRLSLMRLVGPGLEQPSQPEVAAVYQRALSLAMLCEVASGVETPRRSFRAFGLDSLGSDWAVRTGETDKAWKSLARGTRGA